METLEKAVIQSTPVETDEPQMLELSALQLAIVGGGIGETTL